MPATTPSLNGFKMAALGTLMALDPGPSHRALLSLPVSFHPAILADRLDEPPEPGASV